MPMPYNRKRPHDAATRSADDGTSNNVKVVVRIRPQNSVEVEGNYRVVVEAVNENILVFDPIENSDSGYGARKRPRDLRKRRNKDLKFGFDQVFGEHSNNTDVFNATTRSILSSFLDGYNCSVFAYGATGAGKTHTMLGNNDNPGVIYQTMMALYNHIDTIKETKTCDIAVSYLEVYNETIRDLLVPTGTLPIREDPGKGVVIPGLSLHKPKTAEELLYMLQFGNKHRTQHPTDANAESSRSHAVFQVFARQTDRTANISAEVKVAKMCLVDLAGSERATVTKNRGSRFREGANINRSLLALGNVINALAENKKSGFIPYRDSKLTRLLKDSLGGNCRTVMIAAVSPSAMSFEDTYNTLRYADRAKNIRATLKKNVLNVDFHMAKYGQIVEELRREITELKGKLKVAEETPTLAPTISGAVTKPESFIGYQEELCEFFTGHQSLRNNQLQEEIALRNLQWKIYRKERCLSRINVVDEASNMEVKKSVEALLSGIQQKSSCLAITTDSSRNQIHKSCKQLTDMEQKLAAAAGQEGLLAELLTLSVQVGRLQSEIQDLQQYMTYTKHVARCQEKELNHNERLLHQLLKLLKAQHCLLKGRNLLTPDLKEDYEQVQRRVTGQELCWEDELSLTGYTKGYTLADMLTLPTLHVKSCDYSRESGSNVSSGVSDKPVAATGTRGQVYQFSGTQATNWQSVPLKVDECSPPKAKRVMLSVQRTDPPRRVDRWGGSNQSKSWRTPVRKGLPSRGPSHQGKTGGWGQVNKGGNVGETSVRSGSMSRQTSISNTRSHNTHTPVKSVSREPSPEEEPAKGCRFSYVNDTITKAKKFSHLHVHTQDTQGGTLNETFTLDGTFTIDPSDNVIPASVIPCVDEVNLKCDSDSNVCTNKQSVVHVPVSKSQTGQCCALQSSSSQAVFDKVQVYNNPVHPVPTSQSYSYSSAVQSQTVTQTNNCPADDSSTSTIMNQSGNSQSSLVSISTLVEGQNLSQNLSNTEDCVQNCSLNVTTKFVPSEVEEKMTQDSITDICSDNNKVHIHTVTKSEPKIVDMSESHKTTKAVRAINFEDTEKGPIEDKSCADIVRTPNRQPLKQMENTSMSSLTRLSSDSDSSFNKTSPNFKFNQSQHKENSKILEKHGMPSLLAGSMLTKDSAFRKQLNSYTPGYMKPTKAHNQRARNNASINSSLDTSDEAKPNPLIERSKTKKFNNHPMSHMRSKSMSNLSSRGAWQF